MAKTENWHGWTIRRGVDRRGRPAVELTNGPHMVKTVGEPEMDVETLVTRSKVLAAEKSFRETTGAEQQAWVTRLRGAVEAETAERVLRVQQRLAVAAAETLVARITGEGQLTAQEG